MLYGVVAVSGIGVCYGQTADTTARQLNEVEVRERKLLLQSQSATPVQTLTGTELGQLNSLSVADAIRYFSGVQLKDYGGIGGLKTINVRSMGTNHTGVFFDGVALGNAQNGQVDLGKYSLENLEEISLYSGQKPELLLPAKGYASASALYLKTKNPALAYGKKQQLKFGFKTGSFNLANPLLDFVQKLSENTWLNINTEYLNSNGKYKFKYTNGVYDTTAVRQNGDVQRFRFQTTVSGQLKNEGNWRLQGYAFLSERGLPGAIIANRFDYPQRTWDRNLFVQGNLEQSISPKLKLLANAKYANDYTRFLDPEYITLDGFLDNRYHEQEAYGAATLKYSPTKTLQLAYATDYTYQKLDANLYRFAYPTRHSFLNVASAALTLKRLSLQASILNTMVKDVVEIYSSAGNKRVWSPTLMFSWQPLQTNALHLRGFYKDIFRMPTFNDLYYTFIGNTLLRPEFTKQYDLGLTFYRFYTSGTLQYIDAQVDGYYNQVTDKIVAQPGANLLRWIMYNIGRVDVKGLDANLKMGFTLTKNLQINTNVNYSYQRAQDVTDKTEETYQNQIPYVPQHSGTFTTRANYKSLKLNYSFIYTGFRYNQKANIIENYMQPWYTHDIGLGYDFKLNSKILLVNAEVNNLLNQYFDVIPNFPMPGRNYRLSLTYTL